MRGILTQDPAWCQELLTPQKGVAEFLVFSFRLASLSSPGQLDHFLDRCVMRRVRAVPVRMLFVVELSPVLYFLK